MRIAYVSLHWYRTRESGVGKKIQSQVSLWRNMGHEARLFMHAASYDSLPDLVEGDYFFYDTRGKMRSELNRINALERLLKAISEYRPDVIYLRYGIYVYPVHRLINIAPVVEEVNTNDLTQHDDLGGVYSLYNRLTRGILLRRVSGLVTVSRELAASSAFSNFHKPTRVIANGVDLQKFSPLPAPSNPIPRLVFIGTPGFPWHGVDKLITFARLVPDIQLDIIGYRELPELAPLPGNILLHGYLTQQDYWSVLAAADVALSTLALHRIQLNEASPLKSRECLAFGLPLVVAYVDTDLDDLHCRYLLKIPNKEDNIQTHAQAIRDFAYQMRGQRMDRRLLSRLDQAVKEKERLDFIKSLL